MLLPISERESTSYVEPHHDLFNTRIIDPFVSACYIALLSSDLRVQVCCDSDTSDEMSVCREYD